MRFRRNHDPKTSMITFERLLQHFVESRDAHRKEYNDLEWAGQQLQGPPKYKVGDVVEFHAGGFGIICKVSEPQSGHPSLYAADSIDGRPYHPCRKYAWHYEGDFKNWIAKSPLHSL